jgi:iron complex outermembrane receptor protein
MRHLDRLPLKSLAGALVLAAPQLSFGQLEEVIVTAERREATDLTTAISVEVFTPQQLALDKLQTVEDLQTMTPNLSVNYQGFAIQAVNIRGVGNAVGNPNIQPGVAVMQDGMIMGETVVIQQAFLDIDTIEVLRGPQGTFVGQASTGGAVRINSARPNFDGINGWIEGRMGDYRDYKLSGAVNLPLSENVSTRFAFSNETRDSFYNNNFTATSGTQPFFKVGPQPGNTDNQNFRASILWQASEQFSVLGRAEINLNRTDADAPYQPNLRNFESPFHNPADPLGPRSRYSEYAEGSERTDPYTLAYDVRDNFSEAVSNRFSLEVSKSFDNGMEFLSETGYQDNDLRNAADLDSTRANANRWLNNVGPDNDYYNQNFLLLSPEGNRLSWLLGASWYHRFTPVQITILDQNCGYISGSASSPSVSIPCPLTPVPLPATMVLVDGDTIQRHAGLYGQLIWEISDTLELEFGARQSYDNNINDLAITVGVLDLPVPFQGAPCPNAAAEAVLSGYAPTAADRARYACIPAVSDGAGGGAVAKFKDNEPTYKIGLNWSPGDEHFIYAFYSRGYKSGGVDSGLRFENEIVDDYEIGYKGTLADGRLQIQAGVFYMDYQAMQQQGFLVRPSSDPIPTSDDNAIFNIGDSTIEGVEFELNGRFGGLGLNMGVGYTSSDLGNILTFDERFLNSAELEIGTSGQWAPQCVAGETPVPGGGPGGTPTCFDYINSAAAASLESAENLFSPELSYNFSLDYAFELNNGAVVRPRVSYSYADASFSSLFQADNYFQTDERELINASISYERDQWGAHLYCTNCADEVFISTVTTGDNSRVIYSAPRQVGVRFRYDF